MISKKKIPHMRGAEAKEPSLRSLLVEKVRKALSNGGWRMVLGVFLGLFSAYMTFSLYAFMNHQSDCVKPEWEALTGSLGYALGAYFFNHKFGLGSFALLAMGFIWSFALLKWAFLKVWFKLSLWCIFTCIWLSLFISYFFESSYIDTCLYYGGAEGGAMVAYLRTHVGSLGAFLIIAFLLFSALLILSPYFMGFLKSWVATLKLHVKELKKNVNKPMHREEPTEATPRAQEAEEAIGKPASQMGGVESGAILNSPPIIRSIAVPVEEIPEEYSGENAGDGVGFEVNKTVDEELVSSGVSVDTIEDYDPTLDLSSYRFPSLGFLEEHTTGNAKVGEAELLANKEKIVKTLQHYGIQIVEIKATSGPTVTLYEIVPAPGVRLSKIKNLEDDIALSLAALGIRIIAPIPGKGTVGIEVPNQVPEIVSMRSILSSKKFQESKFDLPVALGKTITNETYTLDLCKMPHMLVAGATGQGKSVGLNAIITSLLYKKHPAQLKFVFVDPKKVELNIYSKIEKHYLAKLPDADEPIITDVHKVIQTLNSITVEMDSRYDLLKKAHARNIKEYNQKFIVRKLNPRNGHKYLPYIVVVVDEFADLIMTAGKEVELPIARIAQLARAVGIHMIIATQRPSANIITGIIKANFPARIAFRVSSMIDSRTILDASGANQLIGRGDMLISVGNEMVRVQCAFVDTPEVERIVNFIGEQRGYPTAFLLPECQLESEGGDLGEVNLGKVDDLFKEAAQIVVAHQQASASLLQRRFSIGYNRAGRLMDQLESAGIVGAPDGSKPRQVLIMDEMSLEQFLNDM